MDPQQFTAIDALMAIWRRKQTVVVFFLCTIIAVGLFTVLCAKTYKSDAKLLVRLGRENSALDVTAGLGDNQVYALPLNRDSEINSIVQMIQNKELFGRVVDKIEPDTILKKPKATVEGSATTSNEDDTGWIDKTMAFLAYIGVRTDLPARERAIIKLQKKIDVETTEKSNVVSIGFESYDPKVAQEIVEAIVSEYRRQHSRTHRSQGGTEFLAAESEIVRQKLFASEKRFEDFKNKTQMISVEDQRKVMVDRIAKLKNELMDTEAQTRAAESEILARKSSSRGMDKSQAVSQTEGAGNEGIDGMRQELFRLQVNYQAAISKYSPQHPLAIQIEQQLDAAKKVFEAAEAQLVEVVQGPNKLYEGAIMEIMLKEPRLVALRSKSEALQEQLDEVLDKLNTFNANETEFIRLKRDMQICDENFKRYSRSLQQASMDFSMQENDLSNLSIFQPASLNLKPVRPNKLVNLVAGLMAGLLGGCSLAVLLGFREFYLNYVDSDEGTNGTSNLEFESILDLPVIAIIPRQPQRLFASSNN